MDREYTLQELRHQYGTGRACHVSGRGKSKGDGLSLWRHDRCRRY